MNPSTREETFMRGISNVLQGEDSGVSIAPSSRTEYFLNEILEAAPGGGGGGGLPPVTSDDNGDFLGVNNGEWGKVGGYSVEEGSATAIPEQTTTTQSMGNMYAAPIMTGSLDGIENGDECTVKYNDDTYTLNAQENQGVVLLGELDNETGPIFTNYPFCIITMQGQLVMYCTSANPTISVAYMGRVVTPSDDFKVAVEKAVIENGSVFPFTVTLSWDDSINNGDGGYVADKALADAIAAFKAKRPVVVISDDPMYAPAIAFSRNTYPNISSLSWIYQTIGLGTGAELELEEYLWSSEGIENTARYYAPLTER